VMGRSERKAREGLAAAAQALAGLGLRINAPKSRVGSFLQGFEYLGAAVVGSLLLPLHRVERPGRRPRFTFGYETAQGSGQRAKGKGQRAEQKGMALAGSERELRARMVALLRAERAG